MQLRLETVNKKGKPMNAEWGKSQSFGYSRTIPLFLFAIAIFIAVFTVRALMEDGGINRWGVLGIGMVIFFSVSAVYAATFSISIKEGVLRSSSLMMKREVILSLIDKVVIYEGLKANWIDLQRDGVSIIRVRDSIFGYSRLIDQILSVIDYRSKVIIKDKFGQERNLKRS